MNTSCRSRPSWGGRSVFLCGAAMASVAAASANAQDANVKDVAAPQQAQSDMSIGDIVVTAQRRSESVREVPMSITAIGAEALTERGITGTADLAKIVPAFTYAQSFTSAPIYTIRGVGLNETTLAASPAVSVYVDEVPLPFPVMTRGASLDLERVEVLKGPQGTLYGQNSTGGAINYIAAKPTSTPEAGGSLSFGRFATVDANAFVSGPITDTLSGRVAVQTTQGGDWQQSESRPGQSLGQTDFLQGRVLLQWKPTSSARFTLNMNGWRDRSDSQAAQLNALTIQVPANATPAHFALKPNVGRSNRVADWDPGVDYRNDDRFFQIALRGDVDVTDHITLTSISAYEDYRQDAVRDIDGTALQILLLGTQGRIKSFSQELRLVGDSGPLKWIVGANYSRDKANEFQVFNIKNQTNNLIFGIPNIGADLVSSQNSKTLAAFGNAELEVAPDLTLQAGARYTENRRRFSTCSLDNGNGNIAGIIGIIQSLAKGAFGLPPGPIPQAGGCFNLDANYDPGEFRSRLNENNVSWRAGAKYKITADALIYANVSRGYKSGLYPTVLASSNEQFAPVKQEKLTAYEAGVKASFLDRTVDFTAAVFYYDYHNKQVRSHFIDPIFVVLESVANAPKSDAIGAEAQLVVRPLRGLTMNLSGSYTDSKIKDFVGVNQFGAIEDFSGTRMPFTPKWQGVGDAEYRWALGSSHEAFVGGSLSFTSVSNAFLGGDPVGKMDARTLVDLRAGVSGPDDRWKAYVWGRNVTNARYQNYVMRITDTVIGYAGKPATYGVTLAVNFR